MSPLSSLTKFHSLQFLSKILGKSVDELTEFCKKLSNGESSGYLSDVTDDSDHDEDGNDRPFNHPFMLKERNEPIVMNIKVVSDLILCIVQSVEILICLLFSYRTQLQYHQKQPNKRRQF